jgi:hypothetical protein
MNELMGMAVEDHFCCSFSEQLCHPLGRGCVVEALLPSAGLLPRDVTALTLRYGHAEGPLARLTTVGRVFTFLLFSVRLFVGQVAFARTFSRQICLPCPRLEAADEFALADHALCVEMQQFDHPFGRPSAGLKL